MFHKYHKLIIVAVAIVPVLFFVYIFRPEPEILQASLPTRTFPESAPAAENIIKEEIKKQISIQFFGDIMLDRSVAKAMGTSGLDYIFAKDKSIFLDTDFTIANLEGPFAPARIQTSKTIAFRFDPKLAAQLKSYGFDIFSLANNHSYDMGRKNVDFTRQVLDENGLGYFGDEYNVDKKYTYILGEEQNLPFKVAFIGLNTTEGGLDMEAARQIIEDAHVQAKFVVVNMHWGEEYKRNSNSKQKTVAHQLIDFGADAIIGHHPHVVQEIEVYKDKYIFYSLGNFIFDQYFSAETQEGMSVEMVLQEDGAISARVFPFLSKKSQVERMIGVKNEEFFNWLNKNSHLEDKKFESLIFSEKNV